MGLWMDLVHCRHGSIPAAWALILKNPTEATLGVCSFLNTETPVMSACSAPYQEPNQAWVPPCRAGEEARNWEVFKGKNEIQSIAVVLQLPLILIIT